MTKDNSVVVGIDLGTTNSSVAAIIDGQPRLIPIDGSPLFPSVVGKTADGTFLVGAAARNQYMLYPELTIRSIKRQMGNESRISFDNEKYTPVDISAMILRSLKEAAEKYLHKPVERAVITVPAYFSDRQRTATKEAGEVAGLKVERILNEPTAAALCYGDFEETDNKERIVMVYDLGGGTFDVSIVRIHGEMTEVLSSHGNTALGGDDFDALLLQNIREFYENKEGVSLEGNLQALSRLTRACEEAKIKLSTESYVTVIEENLSKKQDRPLHLEKEISREEYENLINHFIERTKDSVQTALREANLLARDLDEVILVGGSSKTPIVQEMLQSLLNKVPRMDINPDHAVALGAALFAGRISGNITGPILIDVTPFTFGTSYVGQLDGKTYHNCFKGIIKRNSPLPARQSKIFFTMVDGQKAIEANVYQGESPDALDNLLLGKFMVEGLDTSAPAGNKIVFDFRLNLDGILEVDVTEKKTGLKKSVTIKDAFRKLSEDEINESRNRILGALSSALDTNNLYDSTLEEIDNATDVIQIPTAPQDLTSEERTNWSKAISLIEKSNRMIPELKKIDQEEISEVSSSLLSALDSQNFVQISEISDELADIIFYLE